MRHVTERSEAGEPSSRSPGGRPRDPRLDRAIVRAAEELLVELGYADLHFGLIADRARTTKPTIYRRWPSKAHLVHEVVLPSGVSTALPRSGSFAADIATMVRQTARLFGGPVGRAALPGLLADIAADPGLHAALLERFQDGVWGAMHTRISDAQRLGEAADHVDPWTLIEAIGGAALQAILVRPERELDDAWADSVTALLLSGVMPRA